jgi:choline dehydrogenase-like flavoprotein
MSDTGALFDVCIIGSGAGGAPVAADLARKGLRVVLLERGENYSRSDILKDELNICRKPTFRPDSTRGAREIFYGNAPVIKSNHLWTGTCVGGGTRVMSGFFFRMKEEDFEPRSNFGTAEEATHQDWPITYQDLAPYYNRVESDIGISGLADKMPEREKPFPFPPLKPHPVSQFIDKACRELGYHPFPTPRAVLSKEWQGREECSYSGFCGSYACMTGAKGSTDETYIKDGLATGNLTILDRYYVYKLETQGNKVSSACYFDKDNIPGKIRARIFIIACSAIETARMLLNSHNLDYPSGLSNSSGQVGKNLTFTVPCEVTGFFNKTLFPKPVDASSPFVQRTIQDFHTLDAEQLTYKRGGSVLFILPHPNPINRMLLLSYNEKGERVVGTALKDKARDYFKYNHLQTDTFIEYLPNPETFVTLSHEVRDYWGAPGAKVHFQPHIQNVIASQVIAQKVARIFQVIGAEKIAYNPNPFTAGEIQQGTCRFGDDPEIFVLDRNCRSHDIKNLYITDGSFMPSGLPVPPTFTIMANSLRVSDYIYKNG